MNKTYNIGLEPYSSKQKTICGGCGRKTFVHYVYLDTMERLGEGCGQCDRASCDYGMKPREFFANNPDSQPKGEYRIDIPRPTPTIIDFGTLDEWDAL